MPLPLPRRGIASLLAVAAAALVTTVLVWPAEHSAVGSRLATAGPAQSAPSSPEAPTRAGGQDTVGSHAVDLGSYQQRAASEPSRIAIPRLGADAVVEAVGAATNGELLVPSEARRVVWFQDGPVPGAAGTAVLAGHVDYDGVEGVFARLKTLQPGDQISVTDQAGATRPFQVVARQAVRKDQLAVAELTRAQGSPRLALVTCGGDFDRAQRSYVDNVVVWAVPA